MNYFSLVWMFGGCKHLWQAGSQQIHLYYYWVLIPRVISGTAILTADPGKFSLLLS